MRLTGPPGRGSFLLVSLVLSLLLSLTCAPWHREPTTLAAAPATQGETGFGQGDRGPVVRWVQDRLKAKGFLAAAPTGYFGSRTAEAVRSFQRSAGIEASGRLGPRTAAALLASPWRITVQAGDTLSALALRHGTTVDGFRRVNPSLVNPERIYPGQTLVVPVPAALLALAGAGGVAGAGGKEAAVPAMSKGTGPAGSAPVVSSKPVKAVAGGSSGQSSGSSFAGQRAGRIALTFNDGPVPGVLEPVLDILARHGVRATFFFCGEDMARHPDLTRRVGREGHNVASHGWSHDDLGPAPEERIRSDLLRTADLIAELTGARPVWFRPPGGTADAAVLASATWTGHRVLFWHNVGSPPAGPADVNRIDRCVRDGAVIMLPGGSGALPGYLDALLSRWALAGVRCVDLVSLGTPGGW